MSIQENILRKVALSSQGDYSAEEEWTVFIDSRKEVQNGFFIPIVGDRFDGHDFIEEAVKNGAKGAFWEENHPVPSSLPEAFPLFFVSDTLKALQKTAEHYLEQVHPTVVAITGSNGKTTTKDMVETLIKQKYKTHKTEGNFNNHIGLPLTILSMPMATEVLILEMGMNHFGEIEQLSLLAKPHFAIITNIGESHIEFLGSRAGIAKAKLEILTGMNDDGLLIMDGDEPLLTEAEAIRKTRTLTVGYQQSVDWPITTVETTDQGSTFKLNHHAYQVPLFGKHNVKNLAMALSLANQLAIDETECQRALMGLKITGMRFEVLEGIDHTRLINDAYNSSPTSMKAAIDTLKMFKGFDKMVAVLGDMFELGPDEEALHKSVALHLSSPITDLVTVGTKAQWIADALREQQSTVHIHIMRDKEEAGEFLKTLLGEKTIMLFKASRGMKLETLIGDLQDKGGISP